MITAKSKIINTAILVTRLARYNVSIIFANKFIWFLLASLVLMLFFSVQNVLENEIITEDNIYSILLLPGILLIFYPTVFGIQSDDDAGVIEILFGIPDYRYKVWLVRLVMVFVVVFVLLLLYAWLLSILLIPINKMEMTYQIMYPILFVGSLSFMFSTIIKNGNGTAVVMVLLGLFIFLLTDQLSESKWNIFLNPFAMPSDTNELIWAGTVSDNRIFLSIGIVVSLVYGLFNLQKREKFI
ncbi:MAG: hypothetical protein JXA61_03845 [Bacteroidales bacterium]|nr:hypothetical protein [Bacteroidales bacterium]